MLTYFPKYFTSKAITLYIVGLIACNIIFFSHPLNPIWWMFGLVEVIGFFYFANELTRQWSVFTEKKFLRSLFQSALVIRIGWMIFSYIFYTYMTGKPFEFDSGDSTGYHIEGMEITDLIQTGNLHVWLDSMKNRPSDSGYTFYLGWQYLLTGKSIIIARLIKTLLGAYTCVLIYKFTLRNFGEEVGRMAAIFCMLMPNLILYCGLHTKEVEMVFLTVAFMERADWMFRSKRFNVVEIAPPVLLAGSLFFFRTVLGASAIMAMFTTLVFTSSKLIGFGKRLLLALWILGVVAYFIGGTVSTEVESTWNTRSDNQKRALNWASIAKKGNKFSEKIGAAVFAPLILVIPFPTVIETPNQENQKIINGGNFVKNMLAFFTLFALFTLIRTGKWREHVLIGTFTIGYLLILALSAFASSERFHQPSLPFELIFAAVGVSLMTNNEKKYFKWWMAFMFVAMIAWSWFKLAGRGMT